MSNQSTPPLPAPKPTQVPKDKKDLALQSCMRLLFFMHCSMKAQGVDNTPLAVSIHANLQLCGHALPDKFKLSPQDTAAIISAANASAAGLAPAAPSQIIKPGDKAIKPALPTPGKPVVLNINQLKKPV